MQGQIVEALYMLSKINSNNKLFFFYRWYLQNKKLSIIKVLNSAGSNYQLVVLFFSASFNTL